MIKAAITGSDRLPHRRTVPDARWELEHSQLYSEELAVDLASRSEAALFRWFLASLLFGARISEPTAKNTFRSFVRRGLVSPQKF